MNVYNLTGQIGSGKSLAQKILEKLNIKCICADNIIKDLYSRPKIVEEVGRIIPKSVRKNMIDFDKIREIIFTNQHKMEELENYIHPEVIKEFEILKNKYINREILIQVIPVIKNNTIFKNYKNIYIESKKEIRIERIKKRPGYKDNLINKIINYQNSIDRYKDNCDYIIFNNTTELNFEEEIKNIIKKL